MQGESRITSHLHHIATSDIAHRQTSDQAQARPGGQDKGIRHFLKQKKKGIKSISCPNPNLNLYTKPITIKPQSISNDHAHFSV